VRRLALNALLVAGCLIQAAQVKPPAPEFEDVAKQAGLTVPHISSPEKKYIVESMSGGVGFIDCDNDGKLDIVTVNGSTVDRYRQGGDPMVTLYHQDTNPAGNLKFTDITKSAGLTRKGWGMGIAVADFDNDGLQDLYVTGFGGNVLYRNLGNCKFEDVTGKAGLRSGGFGAGAAWGDYDRDGNVDLFIARYVHLDINAGHWGCREKPIFSSAIAVTERSRRLRKRRECTTVQARMACSRFGSTTTMTVGPTSTWRTMRAQTISITTNTTEHSKTSA
jgi:hypothetical protein